MSAMLSGRKGGSDSPPAPAAPRESPNTLRSKNVARVIDAISEGPIKGLVNGLQSIFFNDTALQNPDGTFNFEGVVVDTRPGDPDQAYMSGFSFVETEVSVGVEVKHATPVVRTLDDPDLDFAFVKIRLPQLTNTSSTTGNITGTSVQFNIEVQPNGGSYHSISNNYKWVPFTGTQTAVAALATGIQLTANATVSGKSGSTQKCTLTVQYRAVGDVTWLTLGTREVSVKIPAATAKVYSLGASALHGSTSSGGAATTNVAIASASFELTGLTEDQYEVQLVVTGGTDGKIVKASEQNPTPIIISGKTTSAYEAAYRVPLPAGGAPWNIRVTRVTADSTQVVLQNSTFWSSYTKVIDAKLQYPDTALIGIQVDAEAFGSDVPVRGYEVEGLLIQIPSNYDPETRIYTGIWDGTFQTAYSNNPAWVLYDILVNSRYGLGREIAASQIDKFALYDIAVYCDELVDNGFGGQEPRFTFNGVINSQQSAYDVVNAITSTFRGMSYWASGALTAVSDAPADPIKLVTNANVIDGDFNYSGTSLKARHTAALVTWNDPGDQYKAAIAVVENQDMINQYGWRQADTVAFGCTSKGQAVRFGKWILDSEEHETETVVYKAGFDHADLFPGQLIAVADSFYANIRYGGKLKASTTVSSIALDAPVNLAFGQTYSIWITLPDGTLEEKVITTPSNTTTDTLTIASDLSVEPLPGAVFIITGTDVAPRLFRVLQNKENAKNEFEITALFHDVTKYARIEQDVVLEEQNFSIFPTGPLAAPTEMQVTEYLYQAGPSIKSAVSLSWLPSADPRVTFYEVYFQNVETDPDYIFVKTVSGASIDIQDTQTDTYNFRVRAMSAINGPSPYLEGTFELQGLTEKPSDVTNFNMNIIDGNAYFSWTGVSDLDLASYSLRFTPNLDTPTWGSSNPAAPPISKDATGMSLPVQIGTYLIKAVDTSGKESANAAVINTQVVAVQNLNFISLIDEAGFTGVCDGCGNIGGNLQLVGADSVDDWPNVDDVVNWDLGNAGLVDFGTYNFANELDLGEVFTSRLTPAMSVFGSDLYDNMDLWPNVDLVENWDGSDPSQWRVVLQVRTTNDDPSGSPTWRDWEPLIVGDYTARAFQWRLLLYSFQSGISPIVTALAISVDMPDRTEGVQGISCPGGGLDVTFTTPFHVVPALAVTPHSSQEGDRTLVTSATATGFHVQFTNSGVGVARTFDYLAKGYGHQS